jgi:hypothetical protein
LKAVRQLNNELSLHSRGLAPCRVYKGDMTHIKLYANCYIMNFFRMLSGWTTLYILCRGNLVTAARCLPPRALNLHAALAFADFWTNTNNKSKQLHTTESGKLPRV